MTVEIKKGQVWQSIDNENSQIKVISVEGKYVQARGYPRGMPQKIRINKFNPERRDGFKLVE
jgi:hypothetical protein